MTAEIAAITAFIEARSAEDEETASGLLFACKSPAYKPDFGGCGGPAADAFWARFDPARTLRDVASVRDLVAKIQAIPHHHVDEDSWFSCSQAVSTWIPDAEPGSACSDEGRAGRPCDCGRDAQVLGMLTAVAARWAGHPEPGSACQADPLDGSAHAGPVAEYVRLCFRNHERAGQLCEACAGPADEHGLRKVKCGECGGPAVMVTRAQWADFLARRRR